MVVFIDGENFRQNLANILHEAGLIADNGQFFKYDITGLFRDILGDDSLEIRYYASEIRMPKGFEPSPSTTKHLQLIKERMRKWVAMLHAQGITYIKGGNLKIKQGKACWKCGAATELLQEKGVDVRFALDIYEESLKQANAKIVTVSSDTDICPAYHKAKAQGARITYVCFTNRLNLGTSAACDETITISPITAARYLLE